MSDIVEREIDEASYEVKAEIDRRVRRLRSLMKSVSRDLERVEQAIGENQILGRDALYGVNGEGVVQRAGNEIDRLIGEIKAYAHAASLLQWVAGPLEVVSVPQPQTSAAFMAVGDGGER